MLTIISGTNRSQNVSLRIASAVSELLTTANIEHQILDLQKLPRDFVFRNDVFGNADPGFTAISDQFIRNAEKFVFVLPEYNGGFPGVSKAFIDAVWPEAFSGKKAALIGISSGRAGNLRGLDHMTGVLHYLGVHVLPKKVYLVHVERLMDEEGSLADEQSIGQLEKMLEALIAY